MTQEEAVRQAHLEKGAELLRELWALQEASDGLPDFHGMAQVARRHAAWIERDKSCGALIRDGQTTIGDCQRERGHDGEHQRVHKEQP